jgi:replicative DNA helicase
MRSIVDLFRAGELVDLITVVADLERRKVLPTVGGPSGVARILDLETSAHGVPKYAQIVRRLAIRRRWLDELHRLTEEAFDTEKELDLLLDHAQSSLLSFSQAITTRDRLAHIADILPEVLDQVRGAEQNKGKVTGIPTGYTELDSLTCGWKRGDVIVIGGRPSMGKSAFGLCLAVEAAKKGYPPVIFSLEMSREQLALRALAMGSAQSMQSLRRGDPKDGRTWELLLSASDELGRLSLRIDDTPGLSPLQIRAQAKRLKLAGHCDLVLIDYLQLMGSDRRKATRENEVAELSRSMKALAKDLDVPVIVLSQLNRDLEERPDKRPKVSDLRESGAIEQDADVILFVYRDHVYKRESNPRSAELILGKQRNGPTGTAIVTWEASTTRFIDAPPPADSEAAGRVSSAEEGRPSWYDEF